MRRATHAATIDVLRVGNAVHASILALAHRYGMSLEACADDAVLRGSYWGESEAGLSGNTLFVRPDTPLHSVLHELSHFVCLAPQRRTDLERDAGGDDAEECAVCYLQILLADELPQLGRERMLNDMDAWGYTFRLGSARSWFESDAADARDWLLRAGVIDAHDRPTFALRAKAA